MSDRQFQDPILAQLMQAPPGQGNPVMPGLPPGAGGGPFLPDGQVPQPMGPGGPGAMGIDPGVPQLSGPIISPLDTGTPETMGTDPLAQGMGGSGDPVMDQMMGMEPILPLYPTKRPEYRKTPKPSVDLIKTICTTDEQLFHDTQNRMAEDVAMYRQHTSGKPLGFLPNREKAVQGAQISNLVNKMANMFSGTKFIASAPYDTTEEEKSSQKVEDACYYIRKKMKQEYAKSTGGGVLQRDEFFYMLLHGRMVYRVLPDMEDPEFPYVITLLDPATCFPTYGSGKEGMIRMVRKYKATVGSIVTAYSGVDPKLQTKLAGKLGYGDYDAYSEYMNYEGDVIEYYDRWWRYVEFMGEQLIYEAHEYGFVPFVMVAPVGEPAGMLTPGGGYLNAAWSGEPFENSYYYRSVQSDRAEKGVGVFHYLKNTHRLREALQTLLYNEVEKAGNPPTITYTASMMVGKETPPLDVKRGGSNVRIMNMHDVQGIPTSPRPTDFSPLMNNLDQAWIEGTMPPGAFGGEMGANASGIAIDTLLNAAKDLALPYTDGWCNGMSGVFEICMKHYRDRLSKVMSMVYPSKKSGSNDLVLLTPEDLNATGLALEIRMTGIEDASELQRVQAVNMAIQAGLYSQRYGMEKMDIENPDRMFQDILAEKAMQQDQMLQNVMIPSALAARGDDELLDIWLSTVVAPSMGMMTGGPAMQGGGMPPAPNGPPGGHPPGGGGNPLAGLMGGAANQAGGAQNGVS